MSTAIQGLESLSGVVQEVEGFAQELARLYPDQLKSVLVHGPAVEWEQRPKGAAVNVLVVLADASLEALQRAWEAVATWRRRLGVEPLFLSAAELERSLDVFPLEFLEMQAQHVCLYGPDVLADLAIPLRFLRVQVEEELKTKALWLRQTFVREGTNPRAVQRMLVQAFDGLLSLCGGLLRLRDLAPPTHPTALLQATAEAYGLDVDLLLTLRAVAEGRRLTADEARRRLHAYDRMLTKLIAAVDDMETP